MCGINGIYLKNKDLEIESKIHKMNNSIIHRGPDDDGVFVEKEQEYSLAMGMRRLSIIDLHSGKQPIFSDDKSQVIVFNGEIYNYKILKAQLIQEGVHFHTSSDTEVILRLYEKHGVSSFGMLDGMFAFSIYDKNLDKIFIARDFFGEKPLYYYHNGQNLIWASELKSILNSIDKKPEISKEALSLYFQLTYIPAPFTIYEGVTKLEPDNYLEFDCGSQKVEIKQVLRLTPPKQYDPNISFEEAKKVTHELVSESVISRQVSDVPIGTFLSGGVDSSIVSLCLSENGAKPIETFSIGFEKKAFDETDKAQLVAKQIGSNHHEFVISDKDLAHDLDDILLNYDEPFADPSALPTFLVSKLTQKHVKVALTGDGGDEVFAGYNKHYMGKLNHRYTQIVPSNIHKYITKIGDKVLADKSDNRGVKFKLNRLLKAVNYDNDFYYNIISLGFQNSEVEQLIQPDYLKIDSLNFYKDEIPKTLKDFRNVDKRVSLEGALLVKVDRASMLTSIECRAPFLNKKLWDFTNELPDNYLLKGWDKKHLLKEAFKDYFPSKFLDKSKQGFGVPVGDWLRSSFNKELLSYIEDDFLRKQGLFKASYIKEIVMNHLEGKKDNSYRVWTFFCFQKWYSKLYKK